MDNFREEIVVRKQRGFFNMLYIAAWLGMIISGIIGATGLYTLTNLKAETMIPGGITFILFGAIAFLIYWKKDTLKVEYEYSITNGFVEVAAVYNNNRRKDLLSFKMKDVTVLAAMEYPRYKQIKSMPGVKKINTVLNTDEQHYFAFIERSDEKYLVLLEPSEEFIKLMEFYANRTADIKLEV